MVVTSILIRYCRSMRVDREIAGRLGRRGLKVVFTSDKRKTGGGAQCTAQCIDPAPTTTTTPGTVHITFVIITLTRPLPSPPQRMHCSRLQAVLEVEAAFTNL